MITRRRLILGGAAVGLAGRLSMRPGDREPAPTIHQWVIDTTLDPQGEFRATAERAGTPVNVIDRDIGGLAMQIDARWVEQRQPIGGVTLPSGAFILERLALRHGMELSLMVEHRHRHGHWSHELSVHPADVAHTSLVMQGTSWRAATMHSLYRSMNRRATRELRNARLTIRDAHPENWNGPARFVSWTVRPLAL